MAEKLSETGTLGAANQTVRLSCSGMGGVAIQVQGTFSGTITFEASVQGEDFAPFRVVPSDNSTAVTTTTTTGLWVGSTVGYLVVRARMSSYSSGKAIVFLQAELSSPGGSGGGGGVGSDVNLIEVGGASIALGQAAMAASLPVVIASDQSAIPITGSITASNPSVGPTGDPVPAEATLLGVDDGTGDLAAIAAVKLDYATDGSVVPQTAFGIALPGVTGPVAGGTIVNPLSMTGAVTVLSVVPGTGATNLGKAEDAAHSSGDVGVMALGVANAAQGSFGADGDYTPIATDVKGNTSIVGNVADDAANAGSPVLVGAVAKSPDGTDPGNVSAENDRTFATADLNRRQFVNTRSAWTWSYHSDGSSALTDASVQADPGDGFQIVITEIIFSTGAATACNIFFEEGSTKILGPWYLEAVAGRGVVWRGEKKVTASTALTVTTSAAIAQALDVQGYIQAV